MGIQKIVSWQQSALGKTWSTQAIQTRAILAESKQKWACGKRSESVDLLRQATSKGKARAGVWYTYGARLVDVGRSDAAFEALKTCSELDPLHFQGLELLIEVGQIRDPLGSSLTNAVERMAVAMIAKPSSHREALDFLLPYSPDSFAALVSSPDVVTRAIAITMRNGTFGGVLTNPPNCQLDPQDSLQAQAILGLGLDHSDLAIEALEQLQNAVLPINSIRRSVRRALHQGKTHDAHALLMQYLRKRPADSWALSKHRATRPDLKTESQLTRNGFPLPNFVVIDEYFPKAASVTYIAYNSLPFHSAGYAIRTQGLVGALCKSGWDVSVLTRPSYPFDMPGFQDLAEVPDHDLILGVTYRRCNQTRTIHARRPLQLYVETFTDAIVADSLSRRPSLIHAASNHVNGLAAAAAAQRLGIPYVYEVRGLWEVTQASRDPFWGGSEEFRYIARMETDAATRATHVLAITEALAAELTVRGVEPHKITVVPNGVSPNDFEPREMDRILASTLGINGRTVVGYIGSVLDYEGLDLLLSAAAILRRKREDFLVLIVGDGPALPGLRRMSEDLGLQDSVIFTGRVDHTQVEQYYSVVDIAPFPRHPLKVCEMVSPLKPFEAMAMGIAVVASDVAALAEIVQDHITGRLHRKGDIESLAAVLDDLIGDATARLALGDRAREWVLQERTWEKLSLTVSQVYRELS